MPGNDNFTKLLLHCDGTNGGTTFTDSNINGAKTVTVLGGAVTSTAQSKFGGSSFLAATAGTDCLTLANSADWDFGVSGIFTIDFWIRTNGTPAGSANMYCSIRTASTAVDALQIDFATTDLKPRVVTQRSGSSTTRIQSATALVNLTWTHIALVGDGTNATLYLDGTSVGSFATAGLTLNSAGNGISINRRITDAAGGGLVGNYDEYRVSKGIARWTANFTPPAAPYDSIGLWSPNAPFQDSELVVAGRQPLLIPYQ